VDVNDECPMAIYMGKLKERQEEDRELGRLEAWLKHFNPNAPSIKGEYGKRFREIAINGRISPADMLSLFSDWECVMFPGSYGRRVHLLARTRTANCVFRSVGMPGMNIENPRNPEVGSSPERTRVRVDHGEQRACASSALDDRVSCPYQAHRDFPQGTLSSSKAARPGVKILHSRSAAFQHLVIPARGPLA
jgi:hypothetical protein